MVELRAVLLVLPYPHGFMIHASKLRRRIAWEAARLIHLRYETTYHRARRQAARCLSSGPVDPRDLPTPGEIREQLRLVRRSKEDESLRQHLLAMRRAALYAMRQLNDFRPYVSGCAVTGTAEPSDEVAFRLELSAPGLECVVAAVSRNRQAWDFVSSTDTVAYGTAVCRCRDKRSGVLFDLTISAPADTASGLSVFRPPSGGPRATLGDLERILVDEHPEYYGTCEALVPPDRWDVYESLLWPLEHVKQDPQRHPEGDALYHSLQVFDLARIELPYDEELLLAALLHDVGKAIDPRSHVEAGLEALAGYVTPRTEWLILHHADGRAWHDRKLGARAARRLRQCDSFDELMVLVACDRAGRKKGVAVPDVEEALDYLRQLAEMCEG